MAMKWLKNPYPFIFDDKGVQFKLTVLIIVFVTLFLYIFEPFNFEKMVLIHPLKAAILYGIIAGGVCLLVIKFMKAFAPNYTAEKNWNIGRQLLLLNITLFAVTVINFIFSQVFEIHDFEGRAFWACFRQDFIYTYTVGFFPVVMVTLLGFYIRLKRNLSAAEELNKKIETSEKQEKSEDITLVIPSNAKSDDLEIKVQDLIFVMADGNYVEFHLKGETKSVRKIIRNTMNNVADQLNKFDFLFRSHRAYIVNLNYIQESSGNAQGYQLKMKNTDQVLPVSRAKLAEFKDVIES